MVCGKKDCNHIISILFNSFIVALDGETWVMASIEGAVSSLGRNVYLLVKYFATSNGFFIDTTESYIGPRMDIAKNVIHN